MICAQTIAAYRETDYLVEVAPDGAPPLLLRVGAFHPGLADLFRASGVASGAFITACNPHSRLLEAAQNSARQAALRRLLTLRGWPFLQGIGQHPAGRWPGEASFLVLGISCAAARSLGQEFEQNAILWCGSDAVPQLLLLA
jgi:hypothetical protein